MSARDKGNSAGWKISLPCTAQQADALNALDIEAVMLQSGSGNLSDPPVITLSEAAPPLHPQLPGSWQAEIYSSTKPDMALIDALIMQAGLEPDTIPKPHKLRQQNWVTLSQQGLEPVRTEKFLICTPDQMPQRPDKSDRLKQLVIPASMAFGTGHHETTRGCIIMAEQLRARGFQARNILDLGSGTGLLAMAASHLWPTARITASDNDPVTIPQMCSNALANGMASGPGKGELFITRAEGLNSRKLQQRAPYDLVLANILARPLIELAPDIAAAMRNSGQLILAGLLRHQAESVLRSYIRLHFQPLEQVVYGDWAVLRLRKRSHYGKLIRKPVRQKRYTPLWLAR